MAVDREQKKAERVVLFDGVCNLCNASVQFMIDRDPKKRLAFAPIQSELAHQLLAKALGEEKAKSLYDAANGAGDPDSIIFIEDHVASTHSSAALRIAGNLRFPWNVLAVFRIVPRPIRDWFYRFVARNRYRWFGKSDTCRIPTPELKARFLA